MVKIDGLDIEPIIGLEVHVQLATRTKMFCNCPLEFGAEPNSRVCPVCVGLPGALPVINRQAVQYAVRTALALDCQIAGFTKWDRKSYYYPDLPKNYQISQYDLPLAVGGRFEFPFEGRTSRVRITRAHLEEDAGKNVHDLPGFTGVDLNRAGTPLLEIVTEPDLHSASEAREFAVQLRRLVRYLGVSEANMQKGQMRFEPNINVKIHAAGRVCVTPIVEVKNLNSFRALQGAIACEIPRQVEAWRETGVTAEVGNKANRGWDDVRQVTVAQREKEEAHDYRYFPDPDLVPLTVQSTWVAEMKEHIPELPTPRTERFISQYRLPAKDAPALVDDRATADLLDQAAAAGGEGPTLARHFLSFWSRHANQRATTIAGLGIPAGRLAELANLVRDGKLNATAAAQVAERMLAGAAALPHGVVDGQPEWSAVAPSPGVAHRFSGGEHESPPIAVPHVPSPTSLAEKLGLLQCRDEDQIANWVDQAIAKNRKAVRDALSNPKKLKAARGFLTGQVMKISGGKADPRIVGALMEERLAEIGAN